MRSLGLHSLIFSENTIRYAKNTKFPTNINRTRFVQNYINFTESGTSLLLWKEGYVFGRVCLSVCEPFTKVLHSLMHIVKLLQTRLIDTEGNMGVMIC